MRFLYLFIFSFFSLSIFGQSTDQSSHKKHSPDVIKEYNRLDSLAEHYDEVDYNADSLLKYCELHFDMAVKIGEYGKSVNNFRNYVTELLEFDSQKADSICDVLLQYEDQLRTDNGDLGFVYDKKARVLRQQQKIREATKYFDKAYENLGEKNWLHKADALFASGVGSSKLGDLVRAIDKYEKAYKIYQMEGDSTYMLHTKKSIIILYSKIDMYDKVEEEYDAIQPLIDRDQPISQMLTHYNRSLDYRKQGKLEREYEFLVKARATESYKTNPDAVYSSVINGAFVSYFRRTGDKDSLQYYMDKVTSVKDELMKDPMKKFYYFTAEKDYYLGLKDYKRALTSLGNYEKYNNNSSAEVSMRLLMEKAEVYRELENYMESQQYFQKYTILKDSIFRAANTQSLLYQQTKFESELKEQEIATKTAELALEKKRRSNQLWIFGSLLIGALLLGLSYLIYRSRLQVVKEKQLKDKYTEDLLTETEKEKKRISVNLHDGVGQNLMLIKNQISLSENSKINDIVEDVIKTVRSISQDLHPIQLDQLGLTGALRNTLSNTHEFSEVFVNYEIENVDGLFTKDHETHIYRAIQELINNVIKHSQAEALKVDVSKHEEFVAIDLKDNGGGFDFTEEYNKIGSLGLKTIKERVRLLGGNLVFDTTKGLGTEVHIQIPYKKIPHA